MCQGPGSGGDKHSLLLPRPTPAPSPLLGRLLPLSSLHALSCLTSSEVTWSVTCDTCHLPGVEGLPNSSQGLRGTGHSTGMRQEPPPWPLRCPCSLLVPRDRRAESACPGPLKAADTGSCPMDGRCGSRGPQALPRPDAVPSGPGLGHARSLSPPYPSVPSSYLLFLWPQGGAQRSVSKPYQE